MYLPSSQRFNKLCRYFLLYRRGTSSERKKMSSQGAAPPLHDAVQQLSWLLGNWQSEKAEGFYPTIKPFTYKESVQFSHVGTPILNFSTCAYDPSNNPMHWESGFLKVNVGTNQVAYISAQNIGFVEISEGEVNGTELHVASTSISSISFTKLPMTTKIARTFKLIDESTLEQAFSMATITNPDLVPHLSVTYKKVK